MDKRKMKYYEVVCNERQRHNQDPASPCRWPGKRVNSAATSKYPNIVAFMRCSIGPYITCAAEIAGISPKEMAVVIENSGDLNHHQLSSLAYQWGCPVEFLEGPELLIVDPTTIQGWNKRNQLETLLSETHGLEIIPNIWVGLVRSQLSCGEVVTYAAYRFSIRVLRYAKRHPMRKSNCVQFGRIDGK